MGRLSFENVVANPFSGDRTVLIGLDDSAEGQLYVYVGDKKDAGTAIEKAGLTGGELFGIKVPAFFTETDATAIAAKGTAFQLAALDDVSSKTGVQLETESDAAGVTGFMRPEDGAWDPTHPGRFYFVTTARFDGPSRLWSLDFKDPADPAAGGTIKMLLDGTEGQRMLDNLTVDHNGRVILQEDPGNNPHIAKVWQYDPEADSLTQLAQHDPARFGTPATQDEESSGVIDVTGLLGTRYKDAYLLDVQAHSYKLGPEVVEDGQLTVMFIDRTKFGTDAAERLVGTSGDDRFEAGAGNDTVLGGDGIDALLGDAGNDSLSGGKGGDELHGGAGNDTLIGNDGGDELWGDAGADQFRFFGADRQGTDTIRDFSVADGDKIVLANFSAGTFNDRDGIAETRGANDLDVTGSGANYGSGAVIDSYADVAELVRFSDAVVASRVGTTDTLELTITDGEVHSIRIENAYAAYMSAGGEALV